MAEKKLIHYRIPQAPVGQPYYRAGQQYQPGDMVAIPEDELAAGWRHNDPKTDKPFPGGPRPVGRHAWKLIEPGKKETSDEKLSKLQEARNARQELRKQLEEQERVLDELEHEEGGKSSRGVVDADDEEEAKEPDDQPTAPPNDPEVAPLADAAGTPAPPKAKGAKRQKRTKDQEL
jgi:hypothetical protein